MPQPSPIPPPGFDDLTVDEQVDYVGSLWDRIAADPDRVPVPDWHREVLEQRSAGFEAEHEASQDWAEVRDELQEEIRGSTSDG